MDKIKIISKECKFSNWLNVYVEKVLLPNNKEVERDIIEKGDAVGIVALNDNNELFLVKQPRVAHMIPNFVELPAGIIEEKHNFNPLNAAKAELREETGCDPETCTWTYLGKYIPDTSSCTTKIHLYLAEHVQVKYELDLDEDEYLTSFTIPFAEAVKKVEDFNDRTFNDSCAIIGITRAAHYLNNRKK